MQAFGTRFSLELKDTDYRLTMEQKVAVKEL